MSSAAARRRSVALACFDAALAAIEPERLAARALRDPGEVGLASGPVKVLGLGKAAAAMARGAAAALGERLAGGVLVVPEGAGGAPAGLDVYEGGHPIPTAGGVAGATALLERARAAGPDDHLLLLVSGGASALATLPAEGISLDDLRSLTDALLRAGSPIGDLNTVRKHLDGLKGGQLARAAAPAPLLALVLSDVVGDPLDVIASGPVSPDPTTWEAAIAALRRHGVWDATPGAVRDRLSRGAAGALPDTPAQGDPCFDAVTVRVIGSGCTAAEAAREEAFRQGRRAVVVSYSKTGEARDVARWLVGRARAARVAAPACLVVAGETTVTVRGAGRGGRNQELALAAALALDGEAGITMASLGTDGVDGPTDAAGAIVDGHTAARARALGLDPEAALADNDSHPLLEATGSLVRTGPTGTNVGDLLLAVVA